jgi:DNA topoisomerase-1
MWKSVKIDKSKDSKIQATGYDLKGRKQYIYHVDWTEKSKKKKFSKMKNFNYKHYSNVISNFIKKNDLSRDCVIANLIKIMEDLNIRVGNEMYKKENGSYGITTLLKNHLSGNKLKFIGKKGIEHVKYITSDKSLNFINRVTKIKGPNLFYDGDGKCITSSDLNSFLRNKVNSCITCKDIRTYRANQIFLKFMKKIKPGRTEKERKKQILQGIDYTANELGNTRKVCRDSYLSPQNIDKFT